MQSPPFLVIASRLQGYCMIGWVNNNMTLKCFPADDFGRRLLLKVQGYVLCVNTAIKRPVLAFLIIVVHKKS